VNEARTLLLDLALVLGVAAITTIVFRRLRQPVVLGYLLAGLIVGPHVPIPLFVDAERIHTLSELGVVLVMFSVGLEFSIRRLFRVIPTSGIIGVIQISTMIWLGYNAGRALGFETRECVFTGAMLAISSTMVVAKVFAEQKVSTGLTDTVFGVLVVQDLAAVVLLALLTAFSSSGKGLPARELARTVGQLGLFLVGILVGGFLIVPRLIRAVAKLKSPETLLITAIGACFGLALLADRAGYSVALGAFVAGSLVAESGEAKEIEELIRPLRDVFAAIFFVAVGMILDPSVLRHHWGAALALVAVVIVGQILSVTLGAFLSGRDLKTSVQAGMSLAQIGEFSFIIVSVGVESKAVRPFLYPIAVAVAVVTTFTSPWLVRLSSPVAMFVDRHLPKPLQTFVSLYGSWLEQLRVPATSQETARAAFAARVGRLLRLLALASIVLVGILVSAAVITSWLAGLLAVRLNLPPSIAEWAIGIAALVVSGPFLLGIVRIARSLGALLGEAALPPQPKGRVDLAAAPRRALIVTLQLGIVLLVGIPALAMTQPFISPIYGLSALAIVVGVLGLSFWRGALNLHEHVQAGAQVVLELLGKQSASSPTSQTEDEAVAQSLLPGLGPLTSVRLGASASGIGKTLAEINLRALTGASVITILRGDEGLKLTGQEPLKAGDVLALAGTREAVRAAAELLSQENENPSPAA